MKTQLSALDGLKLAHESLGKLINATQTTDLRVARMVIQASANILDDLVDALDQYLGDVN